MTSCSRQCELEGRMSLEQLIEEINFQRAKEMRNLLKDDSGFVMLHGTAYWTDLFVRHFLHEYDRNAQESDDLLFFVRKRHLKEAKKFLPSYETLLEVHRRDDKKLPIGDPEIDWEETIYANLIIHTFDYYVTLAVCTRTSPRELQVLKRHTERVWASPSRRLMSDKGTSEDITYPNICFMLDNFSEVFSDTAVRDGEMVSVELVARDRFGYLQSAIFLGSVRYDALKRVYDARTSLSSRVAQRVTFGLFSSAHARRMEFVRVKGPMGKGHAEVAVTRPPGTGCESPTSESDHAPAEWLWGTERQELQQHGGQRRQSEPSATFRSAVSPTGDRGRARGGPLAGAGRDRSGSPPAPVIEIEAEDVRSDGEPCRPVESSAGGVDSLTERKREDDRAGVAASARTQTSAEHGAARTPTAVPTDERTSQNESPAEVGQSGGSSTAGEQGRGGACGQRPAPTERCACARTPDGTVVHYRCHVQKLFLRGRELEEGVYNPIWTMRGLSQTLGFGKDGRRPSSPPLSVFLTYVMLPWHAIINDLITKEDRQDPILSF
ncbi:uncharacterized protein KIAA0930 homolog [Pollicipes pollicipes]|uniref:uncharacterized protein KIAA0930 homolog n=1 Tax=Pollicipes pollicipes TaxID=41117 RepID=UPI0018857904|nr:uncharacterized protein KIAA0930 homolog [Pollicipes pollicipes]